MLGGTWLAVEYPLLFLVALLLFLIVALLLIRLIVRGLRRLFAA